MRVVRWSLFALVMVFVTCACYVPVKEHISKVTICADTPSVMVFDFTPSEVLVALVPVDLIRYDVQLSEFSRYLEDSKVQPTKWPSNMMSFLNTKHNKIGEDFIYPLKV